MAHGVASVRRRAAVGALLASMWALGTARPVHAIEQVTVTPNSELQDIENVNVSGTGFLANRSVFIYQCADVTGELVCTQNQIAASVTNSSGAFPNTAATVRATFQSDEGPVQCKTQCRVRVEDSFGNFGERAITFDSYTK